MQDTTDNALRGFVNLLVAIGGGSSSGKSTVAKKLRNELPSLVVLLEQDSFYKPASPGFTKKQLKNRNYDVPEVFDEELIMSSVDGLLRGMPQMIPEWDYGIHGRKPKWVSISPAPLLLFEGLHALYFEQLLRRATVKVFVDAKDDERFRRRILRDMKERKRTARSVCQQWPSVQSGFLRYVRPTKDEADIIIPRGGQNDVAYEALKAYLLSLVTAPRPLPLLP